MAGPGDLAPPHILGYLFNWGLYGALVVQTYLYYIAFPKDRNAIRILVLVVFLLETAQSGMLTHDAFVVYGKNFGNVQALSHLPLSWFSIPILTTLAGCATQGFFAFRLRVLSDSFIVPVLVAALSLVHGCAGIIVGVRSYGKTGAEIASKLRVPVTTWLTATAACDVVIAAAMTYYLSSKRTGYKSTDVLLTKLIRLVIETGTLTAILAVLVIILMFVPGAFYQFTFVEMIGKLYSNNLLVLLNRRIRISQAEHSRDYPDDSALASGVSGSAFRPSEYRLGRLQGHSTVAEDTTNVHVKVETWAEADQMSPSRSKSYV